MQIKSLATLGVKHVRNALAEELYIRTGRDFTMPTSVYGEVVERCNYKCRYCDYWRRPNYRDEMTIDEWKRGLTSIRDFLGTFHIEFSGGEPYIKKGFTDLIAFCHESGIHWGVTTNGSAFGNRKIVEKTVAARPFNVNISIDAVDAAIHDYSRGVESSFKDIVAGIRNLSEAAAAAGTSFPIIIKPVVHRLNFRHLPDMVERLAEFGGTALNFQPVERGTAEVDEELWIGEEDMPELTRVRDTLLRMKRAGAPILSSEQILEVWPNHFRGETAPPEVMPCRVGMRNFFIRSDGRVEVCWFFPPIGDLKTQSAKEIWHSERARERRRETIACDKLCLFTCLSQKTIADKVRMGVTAVTGGRKTAA